MKWGLQCPRKNDWINSEWQACLQDEDIGNDIYGTVMGHLIILSM